MTVISVHTDEDQLTVTVIADFEATVERVWGLWSDPRALERWWGPPGYPATFETHDLVPGGEVTYFMTGPQGETHRGLWHVSSVDPPSSLSFADVFADVDGAPRADLPATTVEVELSRRGSATRMVVRSRFESREHLDRWLATGTREGLERAIAQMDGLLAP